MAKLPVIAAVDDIFFGAKIRGTAQAIGVEVRLVRTHQAIIEAAREGVDNLLIVDLHAKQFDPFALARALKDDAEVKDITLLGFFSHVQVLVRQQATDAGYDVVLPRSAFVNRLAGILEGKI